MTQTHSAILANQSPSRDGAARAMKARGDLAGAIQAYRRLLSSGKQVNWTAMLEPRHVLELARLLEQAGDKSAARQEYQRFLEFWKNADAAFPKSRKRGAPSHGCKPYNPPTDFGKSSRSRAARV